MARTVEEWPDMVLRLVAASLFVTVTAYAQAPGEMEAGEGVGPGGVAPIVVASPCGCGGAIGNVMENRWAVGVSVGSVSLAQRNTGNDQTQFDIGQLSIRYRATLHLEVELALGGGSEQLQDGSQGDHQVNMAAFNLRYRFRPQAKWNWWLMGGLGGLSVTEQGATDQDRQNAQRPFMDVGIGIERRFRRFALHAELSALSIGPMKNEPVPEMAGVAAASTTPGTNGPNNPAPQPTMSSSPTDNLAGGQFTIGASYYF